LTLKALALVAFLVGIRFLGVVNVEETREIRNLFGGIFRNLAPQARA
jgi:hypothetical protein